MDITTQTSTAETILKSEETLMDEAKKLTEELVEERVIEDTPFRGVRFEEKW